MFFCFPSPWPRGWLAPRRSSYHHHLVSSLRRLQWGGGRARRLMPTLGPAWRWQERDRSVRALARGRSARGARLLDGVDAMYWQVGPSSLNYPKNEILFVYPVAPAWSCLVLSHQNNMYQRPRQPPCLYDVWFRPQMLKETFLNQFKVIATVWLKLQSALQLTFEDVKRYKTPKSIRGTRLMAVSNLIPWECFLSHQQFDDL